MNWFNSLTREAFNIPARLSEDKAHRLGRWMGRALFFISPHYRRIALSNLRLAYGEALTVEERRGIALSSFENMGLTLMEALHSPGLDSRELAERIEFDGLDNLRRALAKNRGVLALTAHFGNWEMMSAGMGLTGFTSNAIVRPLDLKSLDDLLTRVRTRTGARLIPKDRAMRRILKALQRNEVVGILMDQSVILREGVFVDFFGHRACSDKGLATIALRTGAAVVPMFGLRLRAGRHKIVIKPELELIRTGDKTRDIEDNTALFTRTIEDMVRSHPDQWLWMHRRWKQRPYDPWPLPPQAPPRKRWLKNAWTQITFQKS
jgi:Kdo2-lipid IVA lauroyltransferase/acyltransferase